MDFTISLAHFCEVHGPTSIICTQASTAPCGSCNPCVTPPTDEPHSAYANYGLYDQPSSSLKLGRTPKLSPFETPPTSPRSPSHNPYFPSLSSSDSSFGGRRPSSTFDSDSDSCENCQMVVPKKFCDKLPNGAPGSPSKDGRGRNGSPVLRSSQNYPVRGPYLGDDASSTHSSEMSDTEQSKSFESNASSYPSSIPPSPLVTSRNMHTHTLTYISTNQPQSPTTYSSLKRTCMRTLSTEVLPRGNSSGAIMFGDPVAGYTIAYIFRIQDSRARGSIKHYALIAMVGRDCRKATKAMVKVTEVFQGIANRITALAEKVERESRPTSAIADTPPLGTSASSLPPMFTSPQKVRDISSTASSPTTRNITPVSSFLSAKRIDPDGFPRVSRDTTRPKSLAEIVGQENFFVELHRDFCQLLHFLIKHFA
ncbi:hypothetical protein N0V87_008012 [Didymella glomerata]|jgi:hypothetical protein|uniref:UDENN FLCN/SMCR8-type domain-containing protein n=1 Tax=Didymella glomerata TaxID=749621 RepID=A0A9W9BYC4_9PLEO|nr:hypothetical protein N0V87_008012 [Didymella glomerata]